MSRKKGMTSTYDRTQEPIILSKPLLDRLLEEDEFPELLALYTFYYYTAKWQQTNRPRATTSYVAKGIGWGIGKVKRIKQKLIQLGLIQSMKETDQAGRVTGWYVQVNFIWSDSKIPEAQKPNVWEGLSLRTSPEQIKMINEIQKVGFPAGGLSSGWIIQRVENQPTNALSYIRLNALSYNKSNALSANNKMLGTKVPGGSSMNLLSESVPRIIEFWNSLPKTQTHRNPNTKTYNAIQYRLKNLMSGLPVEHTKKKKPIKQLSDFCTKFGVDPNILYKKHSEAEIKNILKTIHDDLTDKRDLPSVLWNRFAGKSYGFSLFYSYSDRLSVHKRFIHLAKSLSNVINPSLPQDKLYDWAKEFENLIKDKGHNEKEVYEVINWYDTHKFDKYTPQAEDAQEFCDKYRRIKRAMLRDQNTQHKVSSDDNEYSW